jgi:hypothetical protein
MKIKLKTFPMNTFNQIRYHKKFLPFLLSVLFLLGCKENSDSKTSTTDTLTAEPPQSDLSPKPILKDEGFSALFEGYLTIKSALVSSNTGEVVANVKKLLDGAVVEEGPVYEVLKGMLVPDLESQRKYFSELGSLIEPLLEGQIQSGYIYKQYCPMAFENTGGYWFSNSRTIRNPYFGSAMLTCGVVITELNAN